MFGWFKKKVKDEIVIRVTKKFDLKKGHMLEIDKFPVKLLQEKLQVGETKEFILKPR